MLFDASEPQLLSIQALTSLIKDTLEDRFSDIWVEGEVSNFKRHSSGHCYFTLKDATSQLPCVMWRSTAARLFFTPQNGMLVRARGHVSVYPPRGAYQFMVQSMQPAGEGALQQAFEALKRRLEAQGWFDPSIKKPLPAYPETIGVVTSGDGAALRDILSILARRFPQVRVLICPVRVQGAGAAEEIAAAIETFNRHARTGTPDRRADVLIVGRGGGSTEDLWAFNEEVVARAIYDSGIPVVSAVGHEVDYSIADFVADVRAATPSMGAELVVPDRREIRSLVSSMHLYMSQQLLDRIAQHRHHIQALVRSHAFNRPRDQLYQTIQRVDELSRRMHQGMERVYRHQQLRLSTLMSRLGSLDPSAPLKRGYAFVQRENRPVLSAAQLKPGQMVTLHFSDGRLAARIEEEN